MEKIAVTLLLISLGLLIVYGLDTMVSSQAYTEKSSNTGFLPLSESLRGGIFGGGAVVLSIIGFAIGRKDMSKTIPLLLFLNGGLIVLGMIIVVSMNVVESNKESLRTVGFTVLLGGILIALGFAKIIMNKKRLNSQ
jgi:hypothetical protein